MTFTAPGGGQGGPFPPPQGSTGAVGPEMGPGVEQLVQQKPGLSVAPCSGAAGPDQADHESRSGTLSPLGDHAAPCPGAVGPEWTDPRGDGASDLALAHLSR